ncbi:MAG: hypothetical protein QOI61_625 [Actinomycetota bacterium]
MAAFFLLSTTPAFAQSSKCDGVVADLRSDLEHLRATADPADVRGRAALLFSTATQDHPECSTQIQSLGAALSQARLEAPGANAKGFLGPIGWMWNTVYYRVYSGNAVMMFTFGWGLFLAPVLLVFCFYAVTRGATSAFRRPTALPPAALTAND